MGQVIQLRKNIEYKEVEAAPTKPLAEEPHVAPVRKRSLLGLLVAAVAILGYGGGFWLSYHYGQRIYVSAVADGASLSSARLISALPATALYGLIIASTMCLVFWAWASPSRVARRIRGE